MTDPVPRSPARATARRPLVVATSNPGKLREIQDILAACDVAVVGLPDLAAVEFPEEGGDYQDNAVAKARAAASQLGVRALADDSGLEVEGLAGAPGPYSARYGGDHLDDAGRVQHLLDELAARPGASRRARFVCWAALVEPDGTSRTAFGECAGAILEIARGGGGFGYDPVFQPDGFGVSMAEVEDAVKNEISHRARALRALLAAG